MENKFDIEDFVNKNFGSFNQEEPDEGHFERFKQKIQQNSKRKISKTTQHTIRISSVAAMLILGLIIFNHTNDFLKTKKTSETVNFEKDESFDETSRYYQAQIDSKTNEIKQLECKQSNNQKKQINEDLNELTNSFNELYRDYKNNPDNANIKNAMITNYQTRVSMLNMIAKKLKTFC
jgi:hypothetical protein